MDSSNKYQNDDQVDLSKQGRSKSKQQPTTTSELLFDVDRLKIYYEKAFPEKLMYKWLAYAKKENKTLKSLDDGTESDYF
jgi:hypothetical protein